MRRVRRHFGSVSRIVQQKPPKPHRELFLRAIVLYFVLGDFPLVVPAVSTANRTATPAFVKERVVQPAGHLQLWCGCHDTWNPQFVSKCAGPNEVCLRLIDCESHGPRKKGKVSIPESLNALSLIDNKLEAIIRLPLVLQNIHAQNRAQPLAPI